MEGNITKKDSGKPNRLNLITKKEVDTDNIIEGCKSSDRVSSNESSSRIQDNARKHKGLIRKRRCNVQNQNKLHPSENATPTITESEEILSKPAGPSSGVEIDCKPLDTILKDASCVTESKTFLDFGYKHLKEEMKALIQQCIDREDRIASLEKSLKDANLNHSELKKKFLHLEKSNEKLQKRLDETTKSSDKVQQDLTAAKSQISDFKREKKELSRVRVDMEKRLAQMTPQNKKMESELSISKQNSKVAQETERRHLEEVMVENRLFKRQKDELREVVIKQMHLVANLRRQVLHLRAGLVHKFTEKEVMTVVENAF